MAGSVAAPNVSERVRRSSHSVVGRGSGEGCLARWCCCIIWMVLRTHVSSSRGAAEANEVMICE